MDDLFEAIIMNGEGGWMMSLDGLFEAIIINGEGGTDDELGWPISLPQD